MGFGRNLTSLLIALAFGASAFADATSDARKAIQANYNADSAAAKRKDVNGLFAHTANDYVSTDTRGKKLTLADAKKGVPALFKAVKELDSVSKIKSIQLKGNTASVTVNESVTMKIVHPQSGFLTTLQVEETNADVWVKTAKGWMKKSSKTLKEKHMQDGQPIG